MRVKDSEASNSELIETALHAAAGSLILDGELNACETYLLVYRKSISFEQLVEGGEKIGFTVLHTRLSGSRNFVEIKMSRFKLHLIFLMIVK